MEYRLPGINQVQINPKAGLTFAAALRTILRSDPDIVLVGEIRDRETAVIAIEAALTGHLVLSTLHTNDAASTPMRLVEMGVEPFLVASALDCVVAQRLARKLCDKCRSPTSREAELTRSGWDRALGGMDAGSTAKGHGLRRLRPYRLPRPVRYPRGDRAHRGDRAPDHRARRSEDIQKTAVAQGMVTLRKDGLSKWHGARPRSRRSSGSSCEPLRAGHLSTESNSWCRYRGPVGEMLVARNVLSRDDLERALAEKRKRRALPCCCSAWSARETYRGRRRSVGLPIRLPRDADPSGQPRRCYRWRCARWHRGARRVKATSSSSPW